jgi:beta-galactosidase
LQVVLKEQRILSHFLLREDFMRKTIRWSRPRLCAGASVKQLALALAAGLALSALSAAQDFRANAGWPGPGQLFVGTCYQPIDRTPEQIDQDIAIMKRAGFNVVRMGDLSWDSFEPAQGDFSFAWFDKIMDKMYANGIRVILDIPGTPAPIWLHRRYPGVDIVTQNGTRLPPAERYMDDISDPNYVREAGILADALTKRYAHHPAVVAIGYDNEIGNGYMSYSEADRQRFIAWLKKKYGTIEELNKAWATQRWSRRLNSFEDVDLPLADGPGPSERFLDLHRYWSDVTVARLEELEAIRRRNMPDIPSISNLWDTAGRRGFDYLSTYKSYVSYGAEGFYPGDPISGAFGALMTKGDLATPIWFNEFTAGGGGYYGTPGRSRMYAYLGLMMGAQGFRSLGSSTTMAHPRGRLMSSRALLRSSKNSRSLGSHDTRILKSPSPTPSIPLSIRTRTVPPTRRCNTSNLRIPNRCRVLLNRCFARTSTPPSSTSGRLVFRRISWLSCRPTT